MGMVFEVSDAAGAALAFDSQNQMLRRGCSYEKAGLKQLEAAIRGHRCASKLCKIELLKPSWLLFWIGGHK